MNKKDKKRLIYEAEKQTQEVKNLKRWLTKSIGLSSITMIMAYFEKFRYSICNWNNWNIIYNNFCYSSNFYKHGNKEWTKKY